MAIKLNGSNTEASPGFTGDDTDTGLQCGTNELSLVTGGSTRATVDSSGRLLVGVNTTTGNQGDADLLVRGSTTQGELYLSRGGTPANNGGGLGFIAFTGGNGADAAFIRSYSDGGTWTNGSSHPSSLRFDTTADGESTPTERMRITSGGDLRFNSGFGSVATAYGVRAFAVFSGQNPGSPNTIRNVSTIGDTDTGRFTINFTNDMPDANYAYSGGAGNATGTTTIGRSINRDGTFTTSAAPIRVIQNTSQSNDDSYICVMFIR